MHGLGIVALGHAAKWMPWIWLSLLLIPTGVRATDVNVDRYQYSDNDYPSTEPLLSRAALRLAFEDTRHVLGAPWRWQSEQWSDAGLGVLGVAAIIAALDDPLRDAVDGRFQSDPDGPASYVEKLGERSYVWPLLAGFYGAGLARDDDRARAVAIDGVIAIFIADSLITSKLKRVFGRDRPYLETDRQRFDAFGGRRQERRSFPSGHSTVAFATASVIASHYDDRRWVAPLAYGMAGLVGWARMRNDQHWASDVAAGALIGTTVGREIVRFNRVQRDERSTSRAELSLSEGQLLLTWRFD